LVLYACSACTPGTRHPFLAKYKVGLTQQGKVTALDVELYNNAGKLPTCRVFSEFWCCWPGLGVFKTLVL
jgi:hypothetical protein